MKLRNIIKPILSFILLLIFLFSRCSKNSSTNPMQTSNGSLTITSLSVTEGPYNTTVKISGSGFGSKPTDNTVLFNGKQTLPTIATPTYLLVNVPLAAGTGNVTVSVNGKSVTGPVFNYQPTEVVTTFAGNNFVYGYKDGPGQNALFNQVMGLAIDKNDNLYVADQGNFRIRKITPDGVVSTIAGNGKQARLDGTIATAMFEGPENITITPDGVIYVSDYGFLRKISSDGTVSTIKTVVTAYNAGAPEQEEVNVDAIISDGSGNIFFTSDASELVGKVAVDGTATAILGRDTKPAHAFADPKGIALDSSGNVFISGDAIYKLDNLKNVTAFALDPTNGGFLGDGRGVALDKSGNLFVANAAGAKIVKVGANGVLSNFAGSNNSRIPTDGPVSQAIFAFPTSIVRDSQGDFFIADGYSIREITYK